MSDLDPVIKASLIIGFVALVCAIFVAQDEARRFLGYDDDYVQKQVDALVEKESNGFEVTE
jgi:hypothetical protein